MRFSKLSIGNFAFTIRSGFLKFSSLQLPIFHVCSFCLVLNVKLIRLVLLVRNILLLGSHSGATLLTSTLQGNSSSLVASAISWKNNGKDYIRLKVVNFGATSLNMKVLVTGLDPNVMKVSGSKKTVLTSANVMDENTFSQPEKVVPHESLLEMSDEDLTVVLPPHSFSSFDLLKESAKIKMPISDSSSHQKTHTV